MASHQPLRMVAPPEAAQPKKQSFWSKLWGGIKDVGRNVLGQGLGIITNSFAKVGETLSNRAADTLTRGIERVTNPIDSYINRTFDRIGGSRPGGPAK